MTVEIISWSISTKVWYRAGIELATPGSAVRHASVARHVTELPTALRGPVRKKEKKKKRISGAIFVLWRCIEAFYAPTGYLKKRVLAVARHLIKLWGVDSLNL